MLKKILKFAFLGLLLIAVVGIVLQNVSYRLADRAHAEALSLVNLPDAGLPLHETEAETEAAEPVQTETETETVVTEPETEPIETEPAETESVETETTETVSETVETQPVETEPVETEPAETEPVETEPAETEPATDEYAESLLQTDLAPLKEKNEDIIGWIAIPGTKISYPLLQGDDNNHYLYYSWDGWWNWSGSIFLDYRSDAGFSDFHSIIYGHRMNNDTMFNSLKNYFDPLFAAENPSVYILTEDGVRRYDVFSAYETELEGTHSYRLGLTKPEDQQKFINYCVKNSAVPMETVPSSENGDRILTLSTCTISGNMENRQVVHFVLAYELLKQ